MSVREVLAHRASEGPRALSHRKVVDQPTTVDAAVVGGSPAGSSRPSPAVRAIFKTETLPNLRLHPRRSVPGSCGTVPPQPTSTKTTKTTAPATYPTPSRTIQKPQRVAVETAGRLPNGHPAAAGRFETTSRRKRRTGTERLRGQSPRIRALPVTRLPSTLRAP